MRILRVAALLFLIPLGATAQDYQGEIVEMNWIGFQQFQEASRVFVQTTEPVRYRVEQVSPKHVVLTLENTRVPLRNNRRAMDTRYFDSPVLNIQPKIIEGPSPSVRIEIFLREPAEFTKTQQDNVLALDFAR
jgi:hypothetical protein